MNLKIPLLFLLLATLTGCNEHMANIEAEKQRGMTDRKEAESNTLLKMEERRLQNQKEIAEGQGRLEKWKMAKAHAHDLKKSAQTWTVLDPMLRFLSVVAALAGLTALFQFLGAMLAKEKIVSDTRLKEEEIRQEKARQKYLMSLAFLNENFEKLSDDQKKLALERLEKPPRNA